MRPGGTGDITSSQLLRRIIETGPGAFQSSDIGTTITSVYDLRKHLDDLDGTAGNVVLTESGGVFRYDMRVTRTLSGTADLTVKNEDIDVSGTARISADVNVHLIFGVDANKVD